MAKLSTQNPLRYEPLPRFYDEAASPDGQLRPHWERFVEALGEMGPQDFARRCQAAQQIVRNNAITYNVYGDERAEERLWTLDPVPLIIPEAEWEFLSAAIAQRAHLLNAILNDCYGPQRLLRDRLLPPEIVFANPNFLRPCHGIPVPGDVRLHFYAVDLARSADGRWWVIADRAQTPSGSGYALENRLVSARTLPQVFNQYTILPLNQFFAANRHGLASLHDGPRRMVLLTPGPYNETYFEHSYLAKTFAIPLVEGADLTVRDQKVYLKTLEGLERIDLIFRRQDDAYCDPLELRGDSLLGVPGLLGAVRAGNVTIANSLGSGLIETPAHKAFLPGLCRALLGEDLRLPNVATWWCGQANERQYVIEHLSNLIIKPAFPTFGLTPVIGSQLDASARAALIRQILARPERYIAQEIVKISTAPVWTGEGFAPRHAMLRAFAAWNGDRYEVMPGGLTRVSSSVDSLIVSMQQGGGSKDTWVLGRSGLSAYSPIYLDPEDNHAPAVALGAGGLPSRVADNLFWLGRYTERVESMIRLLRAVVPALFGEEDFGHNFSLDAVLRLLTGYEYLPAKILVAPLGEQLHQLGALLARLVQDPAGISGLAWNLKQIRRTAWPLKERLSGDTWRVLQQLELEAAHPSNPFVAQRPASLMLHLDQAITLLSAFAGMVSDSTTRGHGWRFLELGRRLERGLLVTDLLRHGLAPPAAKSSLELILQIADSPITYRSRYLTVLRTRFVLELLLIDETNPRSAAFQIGSLTELAEHLPQGARTAGLSIESRLALKALTAVRLADPAALENHAALAVFLQDLRTDLFDFSEAITGRFFSHVMPSRLWPS